MRNSRFLQGGFDNEMRKPKESSLCVYSDVHCMDATHGVLVYRLCQT